MVISLSLHLYFTFLRKTVGKKIWKFRRSSTLITLARSVPHYRVHSEENSGEAWESWVSNTKKVSLRHRSPSRLWTHLNFVFLRSNNGGSKERFITAQKRRFRRQDNDSELDSGTNEEKEADLEHQLQIFSDKLWFKVELVSGRYKTQATGHRS